MKFITIKDLYLLVVIALIKVVSWSASPKVKELVVKGIACAAYQWSRTKRRRIQKNLSEVIGGTLGESERREIVKRTFYEFWRETFSSIEAQWHGMHCR